MFILGGIGLVLGILAVIFWTYFMYLWRTWETKRDPSQPHLNANGLTAIEAAAEALYDDYRNSAQAAAIMSNSRRKSVSFVVAKQVQDGDNISFDISHRSVTLGGGGGSSRSSSIGTVPAVNFASSSPTPSAPTGDANRRDSMEQMLPVKPYRRLSLAPEDALLPAHHRVSSRRAASFREYRVPHRTANYQLPPRADSVEGATNNMKSTQM